MTENKQLQKLTEAIELLLTRKVEPVAPVAPVAPVLPIVQTNTGDHDLLQKLDVKVDLIQSDITELKKQNSVYVNQTEHNEVVKIEIDHELRIRSNSNDIITIKTQIKGWGIAIMFGVALIQLFFHFIK